MNKKPTRIADSDAPAIENLIAERGWLNLATPQDRIGAVYSFVRLARTGR